MNCTNCKYNNGTCTNEDSVLCSIKTDKHTSCDKHKKKDKKKGFFARLLLPILTFFLMGNITHAAELSISKSEYILVKVMLAEARGECEEGRRLVVDCILNRLDSGNYGDTIFDVLTMENQFESVESGAYLEMEVKISDVELVLEEIKNRTDNEVMHFRADEYHNFGTPMFQVGNHYFSK